MYLPGNMLLHDVYKSAELFIGHIMFGYIRGVDVLIEYLHRIN